MQPVEAGLGRLRLRLRRQRAAKDAFLRARAAARAAGAPDVRRSVWWLDVETHNTWESLEYGETTKFLRNDTAVLPG